MSQGPQEGLPSLAIQTQFLLMHHMLLIFLFASFLVFTVSADLHVPPRDPLLSCHSHGLVSQSEFRHLLQSSQSKKEPVSTHSGRLTPLLHKSLGQNTEVYP